MRRVALHLAEQTVSGTREKFHASALRCPYLYTFCLQTLVTVHCESSSPLRFFSGLRKFHAWAVSVSRLLALLQLGFCAVLCNNAFRKHEHNCFYTMCIIIRPEISAPNMNYTRHNNIRYLCTPHRHLEYLPCGCNRPAMNQASAVPWDNNTLYFPP